MRKRTGVPVLSCFFFSFLWVFWLAWRPGVPVRSSTFKLDTGTGAVSLSVQSFLSRVSLSLDVVVGEEDELDEVTTMPLLS